MTTKTKSKKIVKVYPYRDEEGKLLYEVVRYEPKDFRTRRVDDSGKVHWNLDGVRKVLYRLDQLHGECDKIIYVVEGEKDADRLGESGLWATCCQGSTNGWQSHFANELKGNRVVVLPDNDEPGRKYAERVVESIDGVVDDWRVVELPGLADKGDVSDWLDDGHTVEQLRGLVAAAFDKPNYFKQPAAAASKAAAADTWKIERVCIADIKVEQTDWLWEPFFLDHTINLLAGLPSAGKTFVACYLAAAVSRGLAWPEGMGTAPAGDVVYLTTENSFSRSIRPRLEAAGADLKRIFTWPVKRKKNKAGEIVEQAINLEDIDPIIDELESMPGLRLLILDPVTSYMGTEDYTDNDGVRRVMTRIFALAESHKFCVVMLAHTKKSAGMAINSIMGAQAFVQVARAAMGVYRDPDCEKRVRRCMVPIKINEGGDLVGKRFTLIPSGAHPKIAAIAWDEEVELRSADDLIAASIQQTSALGRNNSADDSKAKTQTRFLEVLDALTKPGDGWVKVRTVREKLNWSGSRTSAVIWDMSREGIIEERETDKELPNNATQAGGVHEIRRRRHAPN